MFLYVILRKKINYIKTYNDGKIFLLKINFLIN